MSLEKIAEHIEKETDTKVKKMIIEAQIKANQSTNEADKKVEDILKAAKERAKVLADEKEEVEKAKINVEKNQIIKKAVSSAFKESMNNLYSSEAEFSKTKEYEKLMNILIKEAKKQIGENTVIFMNKEDLQTFGKKEKNAKLTKRKIFGIYAESPDGKFSIDLSLDKIIQSMEEKIAKRVIEKLEK
jgi:vacuolar-type H+-ATPase subunit E/Vma4